MADSDPHIQLSDEATRFKPRRRSISKPLWQETWVLAAVGGALASAILSMVLMNLVDDSKPSGNQKGATTAKVDRQAPRRQTDEERKAELQRLAREQDAKVETSLVIPDAENVDPPIDEIQKSANAEYQKGIAFYEREDYDTAVACFSEAIRLKPKFAEAYNKRGLALVGKPDEAIRDLTTAIRLKPDLVEAYKNRAGKYHFSKRDYDSAIKDLSEALRLDRDNDIVLYFRAMAYVEKKSYREAIVDYTECIRLKPEDPEYYSFRSDAYEALGKFEEAIEDTTKSIRLYPSPPRFMYSQRASLYAELGKKYGVTSRNYSQAILCYSRAINDSTQELKMKASDELGPPNYLTLSFRGSNYFEKGRYTEISKGRLHASSDYVNAIRDYSEAIKLLPGGWSCYNERGRAYQKLGMQKEAEADFAKSKALYEAINRRR